MKQNAETGRRGNDVGRLIGQAVANKFQIELEVGSNKGLLDNKTVVIKSARVGNTLFGITNRMAEELDEVLLAKETNKGHFDLYRVEFKRIRNLGRPTRSKGSSSGKVTNFRFPEAISQGTKIDEIFIDIPSSLGNEQ